MIRRIWHRYSIWQRRPMRPRPFPKVLAAMDDRMCGVGFIPQSANVGGRKVLPSHSRTMPYAPRSWPKQPLRATLLRMRRKGQTQ